MTQPDILKIVEEIQRQPHPLGGAEGFGEKLRYAASNPLEVGMAALEDSAPFKALEALDRNVFRHAEQPLAELFNPDSWRDVDWSFRMGGNPNTKYGRHLDKRQASFEELVGRQPTYMENLDIGQDETPFLAQLLAGLGVGAATGGASFSPRIAASAPTIGRNLRQLGQLQGGNVGQLQNLGGRAVEGIGRAAQPFAKVDFALDDFTKEALQGVRSGGRRLFSGFGGGAPQPTSIATMPTGLADIPALAEPPNISQAQPLVSPGVQPGAGVVPATPTTAAPSPEPPRRPLPVHPSAHCLNRNRNWECLRLR